MFWVGYIVMTRTPLQVGAALGKVHRIRRLTISCCNCVSVVGGEIHRLPALVASLYVEGRCHPDSQYARCRAARQATSTVPIVVMAAADLVSSGLVPSIARPGGNLTGLTFFFAEICAKRVEVIKEAIRGQTAGRSRKSRQPQRRNSSYGHAAYSSRVAS